MGASTLIGVPLSIADSMVGNEFVVRSRWFWAKSDAASEPLFVTMTSNRAIFLSSR